MSKDSKAFSSIKWSVTFSKTFISKKIETRQKNMIQMCILQEMYTFIVIECKTPSLLQPIEIGVEVLLNFDVYYFREKIYVVHFW